MSKHLTGICGNCGATYGLHQYETNQCPASGVEARFDRPQQWQQTIWVDSGQARLEANAEELLKAAEKFRLYLNPLMLNTLPPVLQKDIKELQTVINQIYGYDNSNKKASKKCH